MVYTSLHTITAACLCFYEWKVKHGWPVGHPTFHHVWPIFTNICYVQMHTKSAEIRGAERKWDTWSHRRALKWQRNFMMREQTFSCRLWCSFNESCALLLVFSRNQLVHSLAVDRKKNVPRGIFAHLNPRRLVILPESITLLKARNWKAYRWYSWSDVLFSFSQLNPSE